MWNIRYIKDAGYIYSLDKNALEGVLSATFTCTGGMNPGVPYWMGLTGPAKLTAQLQLDEVVMRLGVELFDEIKVKEAKIPRWNDKEREFLRRSSFTRISSCQRSSAKPMKSNPGFLLEEEFRVVLPYLDALFQSMEGLNLQLPFREVAYYQSVVRKLTQIVS